MRKEALRIMEALESFFRRLVGSVWRGTAYLNSDMDILVFAADGREVVAKLMEKKS